MLRTAIDLQDVTEDSKMIFVKYRRFQYMMGAQIRGYSRGAMAPLNGRFP